MDYLLELRGYLRLIRLPLQLEGCCVYPCSWIIHVPPMMNFSPRSQRWFRGLIFHTYTTWNPSWSCSIPTSENISSMKSSSGFLRPTNKVFRLCSKLSEYPKEKTTIQPRSGKTARLHQTQTQLKEGPIYAQHKQQLHSAGGIRHLEMARKARFNHCRRNNPFPVRHPAS